jgi:protein O-GlcNAc transferase
MIDIFPSLQDNIIVNFTSFDYRYCLLPYSHQQYANDLDSYQDRMHTELKARVSMLLQKGNIPMAELLLRTHLEKQPSDHEAYFQLGRIAAAIKLPQFALQYFNESIRLAPNWQPPLDALKLANKHLAESQAIDQTKSEQSKLVENFILIKAWGYGFWSDVSHVLSQLLVAELTGRTPVVHWGTNSLFGDGTSANAFEFYFEPVSKVGITDLQNEEFDIWPPKWNRANLTKPEINKWSGPNSRVSSLYFLGRKERVVVSDFFTSVVDLQPWIPSEHHLYGLTVDELWMYLVRQHLHPKKEVVDAVDRFYEEHIVSPDFLAVHIRGSDKTGEQMWYLDDVNRQYKAIVDRHLSTGNFRQIFLLTDDTRILDYFKQIYGEKIITTDCQRTGSTKGVHYLALQDRRKLGIEVMVDVYLAARARIFIGNGLSNPSRFVRYIKDWPEDAAILLGTNLFHKRNEFIHNW